MNSNSPVTVSQSPATTGKLFATEIVDNQHPSGPPQSITTESQQLRIDHTIGSRKPHYRARQLAEFTTWLQHSETNPVQSQFDESYWTVDACADVMRIDKLYRVDSGSTRAQMQSSNPAAQSAVQSFVTSTSPSGPHFPTNNYRPPNQESQIAIKTPAPMEEQVEIPTDGFDPMSGIRGKVDELRQNGKIIGSLQQPPALSTASWEVPSFIWPVITNQLLGEPGGSIASLSNTVAGMMSTTAKRLAVTGTGDGVGCTTIAMCIARRFAKQGKRVLLVDADLAQPKLAMRVGLQQRLSWLQALSNRRPVGDVVVSSTQDHVCVMPLAPIVSRVSWNRKIYDHLGRMLGALSSEFDLIVLDMGNATQMMSETTAPDAIADGVVLVSSENLTTTVEFQRTQAGLLSFGVNHMVVAQNFKSMRRLEPAMVG